MVALTPSEVEANVEKIKALYEFHSKNTSSRCGNSRVTVQGSSVEHVVVRQKSISVFKFQFLVGKLLLQLFPLHVRNLVLS